MDLIKETLRCHFTGEIESLNLAMEELVIQPDPYAFSLHLTAFANDWRAKERTCLKLAGDKNKRLSFSSPASSYFSYVCRISTNLHILYNNTDSAVDATPARLIFFATPQFFLIIFEKGSQARSGVEIAYNFNPSSTGTIRSQTPRANPKIYKYLHGVVGGSRRGGNLVGR